MTDTTRLEKMLDDPSTPAGTLAEEASRLRAKLAAVEKRGEAKAREEAEARERAAEAQREQAAADAEAVQAFDAIVQQVREMFPGVDKLAPSVDAALARHRARTAPLVTIAGADVDAVANRVLWSHPLARLLPLLDMLRSDGDPPGRR